MLKRILLGLICGWGLSALFLISVSLVAPPPGEGRDLDIVRQARLPNVPVQIDQPEPAATAEALPQEQVVADAPAATVPAAEGVTLPAGSQFNRPREDGAVTVAGNQEISRPDLPVVTPQATDAPPSPQADTRTVTQPQAVQIVTSANAPEAGEAPNVPTPSSDAAPRTFRDTRMAEAEIAAPAAAAVETEPATPEVAETIAPSEEAPDVGAETAPLLAEVPAADVAPPDPEVDLTEVAVLPTPDPVTAPAPGDAPESEAPAIARVVPAEPDPGAPSQTEPTPEVEEVTVEADPDSDTLPTDVTVVPPEEAVDESETADAAPDAAGPEATETEAAEPGIRILRTDRQLAQPGLQDAHEVASTEAAPEPETGGSLPRRLVLDSARDAPEEEVVEAAPEPVPPAADQPALLANAASFENAQNLPLLAVVLVADQGAPAGLNFDFPVTIAIDGAAAEAGDTAIAYRQANQEVMLLADALAMNGAPQDVEIALAGARNAVPQAIGVLDRPEGGFSTNRAALAGLMPALADAGMGFVTYPSGLNSGLSTARREGVAAASVLRRIDAVGEGLTAMDRALSRAAFEAGRDGAAVVVVSAQPDVVAALRDWQAGGGADAVALAPISAVLRGDAASN